MDYFTCRNMWSVMISGTRKPNYFSHSDINWLIRCSRPSCSLFSFHFHLCRLGMYRFPWKKRPLLSLALVTGSVPRSCPPALEWLWMVAVSLLGPGRALGWQCFLMVPFLKLLEVLPVLDINKAALCHACATELMEWNECNVNSLPQPLTNPPDAYYHSSFAG